MRYLIRRVGFYLVALWASVTLTFILPRLMPGDPAQAFMAKMQGQGQNTKQELAAIRNLFGVDHDTPLIIQYWKYLVDLLHGHLGISTTNLPEDVSQVIIEHLPWTIALVGISLIISFVLGTFIGMLCAWKHGSWFDTIIPPILTFLSAIPYFIMALALLYEGAFVLGWFPLGDGYDVLGGIVPGWTPDFIASAIQHGILPVVTIVLGSLAGWVFTMRNTMITTLSEDFVLMAQAKGLREGRVMFSYAARNAILPSVTSISMSLGLIVGGSLLTEMVFNYPGIGYTLYNAVTGADYGLIEGCFLVIAIAVLLANFLSELLYSILDPRVHQGRS